MSCQTFLPVSLTGSEAAGCALLPCSVDSPDHCEQHEESLSVFCLDDLEPLCKQCAAVSHAGHRVYLLTEAAADCKEELRTSLNGLRERMMHLEKVTQTCEHASRHNQAEVKLTEEHMKKEFEGLHQFLREEEAARLLALRENQEEKKREAEERVDRMNQVIKSLEDKIQLIEKELDAGGDGIEFLECYQDMVNSTWAGSKEPQKVCRPLIDVAKHVGNLQYAVWEKMKDIAPCTLVTLDPRTAGQSLRVSPELNSVHLTAGPSQRVEQSLDVPANPERFQPYSCILAREGFDSGVHSWDVEVGDTDNWTVGVAAQSVSRRTEFEACPEAGLWCISLRDGKYRALTTPSQDLSLENTLHLSRLHVRLDWDEGTLAFMDADAGTHLFTFKQCFTEKVYPYFETISLHGSLTVLAKKVNISVGSDCVSLEDSSVIEEYQVVKSQTDVNVQCGKTGNKNSVICSVKEEKRNKAERCITKHPQIQTKHTKGKTPCNKPRFSVSYHVSLNRVKHQQ